MKSIVHFALIALTAISFASCIKSVDAPVQAANPLAGSWIITNATENDGNGWYSFDAGIGGVLNLYSNGEAQYNDGYTNMQGNWYSYTQSSGYYDAYGNYYNNTHQTLQVQTSSNAGGSLSLNFDDFSFTDANEFIATYFNGKGIEKYVFDRY